MAQLANSLTRRPGQGGGGPHLRSHPPPPSPSATIVREGIWDDEPVLSCSWSSLSPRSATFVMFSRMMPTVSSICCWIAAVFELPAPAGFEEEPPRGRYGSYGSDL